MSGLDLRRCPRARDQSGVGGRRRGAVRGVRERGRGRAQRSSPARGGRGRRQARGSLVEENPVDVAEPVLHACGSCVHVGGLHARGGDGVGGGNAPTSRRSPGFGGGRGGRCAGSWQGPQTLRVSPGRAFSGRARLHLAEVFDGEEFMLCGPCVPSQA